MPMGTEYYIVPMSMEWGRGGEKEARLMPMGTEYYIVPMSMKWGKGGSDSLLGPRVIHHYQGPATRDEVVQDVGDCPRDRGALGDDPADIC